MANIADNAGIFTGATLDAFNQMEAVVQRDGDVAGAAEAMRKACLEVCAMRTTSTKNSNTGDSSTRTRR